MFDQNPRSCKTLIRKHKLKSSVLYLLLRNECRINVFTRVHSICIQFPSEIKSILNDTGISNFCVGFFYKARDFAFCSALHNMHCFTKFIALLGISH